MDETLALRHEMAKLLGFNDYAEMSLATKMAESPEQVLGFVKDLADKSMSQARRIRRGGSGHLSKALK